MYFRFECYQLPVLQKRKLKKKPSNFNSSLSSHAAAQALANTTLCTSVRRMPTSPKSNYVILSVSTTCCTGALSCFVNSQMRRNIALSFVSYHLLYSVLCSFPHFLQPKSSQLFEKKQCRTTPAEWRDKVLSTVNALVQIAGGVMCYFEWESYQPLSAGWISIDENNNHFDNKTHGFVQYTGAALMGYLIWDLSWMVWHYGETPDKESIVHHVLFLLTAYYNAHGWYFSKCFAWM